MNWCMTLKISISFQSSSEDQFMEEVYQEMLKQVPEVKGLAESKMGFEWGSS